MAALALIQPFFARSDMITYLLAFIGLVGNIHYGCPDCGVSKSPGWPSSRAIRVGYGVSLNLMLGIVGVVPLD
jgi:hypothetical protein